MDPGFQTTERGVKSQRSEDGNQRIEDVDAPRASHMTVTNRWLRWMLASSIALVASIFGFMLFGLVAPVLVLIAFHGKWEDQPIGSGFILVLIAVPLAILCFIAMCWFTVFLSDKLAPRRTSNNRFERSRVHSSVSKEED